MKKQLLEGSYLEVVVFEVGGRRYGLPASDVRELVRVAALMPLPRAPAVVEGILNLRGRVVPVYDIRSRFGLPPKAVELTDHLIVAQAGERLVAVRVDRALDLVRVNSEDIEDAKGLVPGVEHVAWVAKLPNNLVLIHDLRTFLSRAESAALDEALPAVEGSEEGQP